MAYTLEMFREDFPQFALTPVAMVEQFIAMAAQIVTAEVWQEQWRYGTGLYVAHRCTLYLRRAARDVQTSAAAAATGEAQGLLTSEKAENEQTTYDFTALLAGPAGQFGHLNSTDYGQEFASMAALFGLGGLYIP